jgi:hypothetical protein
LGDAGVADHGRRRWPGADRALVGAADADDRAGQGRPRDSAERPHGIETLEDAIRERGYDPDEFFAEIAATNEKLDSLRIVLDSDPRKMTQAGQLQGAAAPPTTNPAREAHVDERLASLERESITTRAAVLAREPNHTTIHNQQPTTSVPVTTNVSPAPVTVIKESAPPPSKIARFGRVTKRDDKGRMLDFEIIEERKA